MRKREKRRRCLLTPCAVTVLFLLVTTVHQVSASVVNFTRSETETSKFNRLTIDRNSGRVFVGAVNWIYQLLPNLQLEVAERTGPQEDSPDCPVTRECPSIVTKPTDSINKVLVIDYIQGRLITCGSLFQGLCFIRKLSNISITDPLVNEPVAANNNTASTVAFIAPGPPNPPTTHVLYVGVSYTGNGPYRTDVPAVCSRSLEPGKMLSIAAASVTTATRILVNTLARERYPINYIYGFHSRGFSYFLTTQKRSIENQYPFVSKLIRICHKDPDYYSYTEIPIECRLDNVDYNLVQAAFLGNPGSELANELGVSAQDDVLYAVFSQSKNDSDVYDRASAKSGLCVYSLRAIHRQFTKNIQHCFSGNGDRGLDFINPSMKCVHTQLVISDDFCGTDVNTPLGGSDPVRASPVITFQSPLLTSVAATSTHDFTVAFLGTSTGHLLKVVIETSRTAYQYSDLEVDRNSPVNADLLFDPNKEFIYVMTERKLTRMKVQECMVYRSCGECLGAKDPYCGWCSLENKCSLRSECAQASQDPLYWLSYRSGKCTTITNVQPSQIQRTTARTLQLTIDNLPNLTGQFVCVFTEPESNKSLHTNATRTALGVSCPTPRTDALPAIPQGQHHFTAKLSVKNWTGPEFVATNFTFYDCNTYSSCTQCVSSAFPCDWCVDGHRCTHDTGENCRNDILVTGINNIGPSIRSGPGFCPRINSTVVGGSTELLVPYGSVNRVSVKVDNMAQLESLPSSAYSQFIMQTRFVCQFNIDGRVKQVTAQLLGDTIYCENMEFKYNSNSSNLTATFAVIWGGSKPLDNPDNIHVLVYRCPKMADNCGLCLALPEKYKCGWCQSSDKCQVSDQCDGQGVAWLDRQKTCPNPRILDFQPRTGPLEGGTKVTIKGINLGRTFEDIQNGVTVAGHQCIPVEDEYIRTAQIVCEIKTPDLPPENMHKGPVIVKVQDSFRGDSAIPFVYVSPFIQSIKPNKGPQSGGTRLRITGEHMNAGSTIQAFIDDLPCKITNTSKHHAECITSRSDRRRTGELRMKFDHGERTLQSMKFHYVDDPKITRVESGPIQSTVIRAIPSGGITIRVHGFHFDAIQEPLVYVTYESQDYISHCHVKSSTFMQCKSPRIPVDGTIDSDNPRRLDLGFIMDNVTKYRNYNLSLYPNPKYLEFEETKQIKYYKSDYLTINGENLDLASKESDVKVEIGTRYCNVTSLSSTQLTCRPPTSQPPARGFDGHPDLNIIPEVVVIVGGDLRYKIGYLSYESPLLPDGTLPNSVIIGVTVGGIILLVIVIAILIAYRIKSTESNRVLKNMQEQMDVLELRVAAECKEAFAELQTEMTDLTSDLTSGGIPFRDYRGYAMKNLFPNCDDNSLKELDIDLHRRPTIEKGLKQFGQLIMNKTFLLLFIRTLESNRYFSMRDRCSVAALIMVALQGKMEYCTDILKTLLAELIEKCIEGKSHPKLLLRRTESVAEKMLSAWFAFLLYKFLKECAGEPLYLLYRAIKQQVDKGPVDAMTSEARYSLSEEKLIRQSIEYKSLTVYVSISPQTSYVSGLDSHSESMDLPVKVLDCDTISQVKEKALDSIYKSTPFSQRPSKDDLDLEWRTGMSGRLILSDEDNTTKTEGEWKKLNTLAHYKVQEGAQLTLVPKQSSMYNLSILSEKSEKHNKYETLNFSKLSSASPPLNRATSPLNHNPETGYKKWHLVKHHDSDAHKEGERGNKMVSEIYLTRLLATKGTLQKFVDDLFETIFSTAHRGSALPLAIKYMFDFLDDQALQHGITDSEVVHTWKSNSLPLRVWVNLIKNPNFVFDIYKSNIVDSCLSVVAVSFMDSCSTSDHRLGKDSPSSKLLYAKDIPVYKEWVDRYYQDIKLMQAISDQDMNAMLAEESRLHSNEFNTNSALYELHGYAVKYNDQLIQQLEEDEFSRKNKLAYKLEHVHSVMAGESDA